MSLIRLLANHVVGVSFDALSPEVIDKTKQCILDNVGLMLAGRYTEKGAALVQYADRWRNAQEATIPGYSKVGHEAAAFVNAGMSRIMDLDDGHRAAMGHPAVIVMPSALALGEVLGLSGKALIEAIAVARAVGLERQFEQIGKRELGLADRTWSHLTERAKERAVVPAPNAGSEAPNEDLAAAAGPQAAES